MEVGSVAIWTLYEILMGPKIATTWVGAAVIQLRFYSWEEFDAGMKGRDFWQGWVTQKGRWNILVIFISEICDYLESQGSTNCMVILCKTITCNTHFKSLSIANIRTGTDQWKQIPAQNPHQFIPKLRDWTVSQCCPNLCSHCPYIPQLLHWQLHLRPHCSSHYHHPDHNEHSRCHSR